MVQVYEVPLTPSQNQQLVITLSGIGYTMLFRWNNSRITPGWVVDLMDSNQNEIVAGIPLVTGANLLEQYTYLGFQGQLVVASDIESTDTPTFDNLGDGSHLYYVTAS